ncbi:hypothetical protein TWF730_010567 [Orbilia blumenaviensis]|uniref:Uncharacterized protein n=1 Tax=Orbilia blumenaviensis TaxID=1796055 RepID=A0AAV9UNM5_9PEZI
MGHFGVAFDQMLMVTLSGRLKPDYVEIYLRDTSADLKSLAQRHAELGAIAEYYESNPSRGISIKLQVLFYSYSSIEIFDPRYITELRFGLVYLLRRLDKNVRDLIAQVANDLSAAVNLETLSITNEEYDGTNFD